VFLKYFARSFSMTHSASPGPTPSHPIPAVQDVPDVEQQNDPVEEPEEPHPPAVDPTDKPPAKRW
jgi:hypothetical protein